MGTGFWLILIAVNTVYKHAAVLDAVTINSSIHPFIHSILCTKCCPFIMLVHVHTSNYRHKPTVHLVIPRNFTIISNLWHSMTLWCFGWFFCFIWNVHMCVDIRLRYDRMIRYEIWEIDCIPNPKFFLNVFNPHFWYTNSFCRYSPSPFQQLSSPPHSTAQVGQFR